MSAFCSCEGGIPHTLSREAVYLQYLTIEEATQIHQQFHDPSFHQTRQVLWTGVTREVAQKWADQRGMQTLTTAMGRLMQTDHSSCSKPKNKSKGWSKYVKGASAIFAYYAAEGQTITVLSPPPPERFHPSGVTSFQIIEEPILKGHFGGSAVGRIELIHPRVPGAEDFRYEFWPTDKVSSWMERFGAIPVKRVPWRQVNPRLYRSLKVDARQFTPGHDILSSEVGLQLRHGDEILIMQILPSQSDDRGNVEVGEQSCKTLMAPSKLMMKRKPVLLNLSGKLVPPITIVKKVKKTKKTKKAKEAKQLKEPKKPKKPKKARKHKKIKKIKTTTASALAINKVAEKTDREN